MRRAQLHVALFVLLSLCTSCARQEPVRDFPGTEWTVSLAHAVKPHVLRSAPNALFATVQEPASRPPSGPPPEPVDSALPPGFFLLTMLVVLASLGAIAGNIAALIRYETDRKKHGADASRRALMAWGLSIGCATMWPAALLVGPVVAIMGLIELRAMRQGKAPPASRIPAVAAVANGLGLFLIIVGCGAFALMWAYQT